ncbi:hypothetical protein DYB26_007489, partial [Aphanomyces astaci]
VVGAVTRSHSRATAVEDPAPYPPDKETPKEGRTEELETSPGPSGSSPGRREHARDPFGTAMKAYLEENALPLDPWLMRLVSELRSWYQPSSDSGRLAGLHLLSRTRGRAYAQLDAQTLFGESQFIGDSFLFGECLLQVGAQIDSSKFTRREFCPKSPDALFQLVALGVGLVPFLFDLLPERHFGLPFLSGLFQCISKALDLLIYSPEGRRHSTWSVR